MQPSLLDVSLLGKFVICFANTVDEATGPWFSPNGKLLYLSIQADPPRRSHIIAISRDKGNFNKPYDKKSKSDKNHKADKKHEPKSKTK